MEVILFSQYALVFLHTSIANIGWSVRLVTGLFFEILAQFVAKFACGALPGAVRLVDTKAVLFAVFAVNTPVVNSAGRSLVAGCGTGTNLSRNSGCALTEFQGDLFYGHPFLQPLFDLQTFRVC